MGHTRSLRRLAGDEWQGLGRNLQTLGIVLFVTGIGGLVVGLVGDLVGRWESFPFLTNLVSGLTGACFGVPFAILVLRSLTNRLAETSQREKVRRLRSAATLELVRAAEPFRRIDVDGAVLEPCMAILNAARSVEGAKLKYSTEISPEGDLPAWARDGDKDQVRPYREALYTQWLILLESFESYSQAQLSWANLVDKWRFLNDHVKPRIFEEDMTWLSDSIYILLQSTLYEGVFPFTTLTDLRDWECKALLDELDGTMESSGRPRAEDLRSGDSWLGRGPDSQNVERLGDVATLLTTLCSAVEEAEKELVVAPG